MTLTFFVQGNRGQARVILQNVVDYSISPEGVLDADVAGTFGLAQDATRTTLVWWRQVYTGVSALVDDFKR